MSFSDVKLPPDSVHQKFLKLGFIFRRVVPNIKRRGRFLDTVYIPTHRQWRKRPPEQSYHFVSFSGGNESPVSRTAMLFDQQPLLAARVSRFAVQHIPIAFWTSDRLLVPSRLIILTERPRRILRRWKTSDQRIEALEAGHNFPAAASVYKFITSIS